jgi:SAM-dependent methyltransferase
MTIAELSRDNPRLLELEAEYRKLNLFDTSQWEAFSRGIDIQNFRGEPGFLSQMWGGMTEARYWATFDYADADSLMRWLGEDSEFGCITFEHRGTKFSRDLLDSIFEMRFVMDSLDLGQGSDIKLLDIGAGYGRFIYRCAIMLPYGRFFGVDAVPLSTFLCEYYLRYRHDKGRTCYHAKTVRLTELDSIRPGIDIACNMYSFSEMPLSAVNFWLNFCADLNIRYFMLVPHSPDFIHPHFVTSEPDGSHLDYYHLFEQHGYRLIRQQPKFPPELAPQMIYSTTYYMFERK